MFDGPWGPEYSIDASYHDAGTEELQLAAEHHRSVLAGTGWQIVDEFEDGDEIGIFRSGYDLDGSIYIDAEMGSVWVNVYLAPAPSSLAGGIHPCH